MFHLTAVLLKTFIANNDKDSVVRNELIPPITTKSIRIVPEDWYVLISLRVELYGCKASKNLVILSLTSNMAQVSCTSLKRQHTP